MSVLSHQLPDSALFTVDFNDCTVKYLRGLPKNELSDVSFETGDVSGSQPQKDSCRVDSVTHEKLKRKYANCRARRKSRSAQQMDLNKLIAFEETVGSDPATILVSNFYLHCVEEAARPIRRITMLMTFHFSLARRGVLGLRIARSHYRILTTTRN